VPPEELESELTRQRDDVGVESVIISPDRQVNFAKAMEVGYLADAVGLFSA
jgi:hypothetical protein